jgi:hypothetical protein
MLGKALNKILAGFGYEIRRATGATRTGEGHELYRYFRSDGTFDYELYKRVQSEGNRHKIDEVWVREENIEFLADYITSTVGRPAFGICHGTRRGKEQEWFRKYLQCDVIGTEISDTAEQFPHTIQWDFHEIKDEWLDAADFIYSNSFDHSYDPEKCLNAWMRCVKNGGVCIIEHTSGHEHATRLDPFGAHISQMPYLILLWGKGAFYVRDIIDAPSKPDGIDYIRYIIIKKQ